jgi:D-glycerate 3-kinase
MIKSNPSFLAILENFSKSASLTISEYEILASDLLGNQTSCQIFKITAENVDTVLIRRSQILQAIIPTVLQAQSDLKIDSKIGVSLIATLWDVWIPLAMQLVDTYQGHPLIQGILGGQGTGKTTMTKFLKLIFEHLGFVCVNLSLDDLYKTYKEREEIKKLDPQIQWRGVPSTHNVQLGIDTLNQLCSDLPMGSTSWEIPRFDKSVNSGAGDRTDPEKIFTKPQIILFEGWFVGVRPVDPDLIQKQVAESDRQFVLKMNAKLQDYLPLWQKLDGLWLLLPQDYRYSIKWRQEAEHKLTTGMSDREIEQFVHYFWRSLPPEIFITPLRSSRFVDLVIEINSDHEVTALTIPVLQH